MKNIGFIVERNLTGKSWMDLSAGIKSSLVLEVIDNLFFPYEEQIDENEFQTHESYLEFVMNSIRIYDMENDNPMSWFWRTYGDGDNNEKFTEKMKKVIMGIVKIGRKTRIKEFKSHYWDAVFSNIDLKFEFHRSSNIAMVDKMGLYVSLKSGSVKCDRVVFNNNVYDQWDGYIMGYIDLIVIIMDTLIGDMLFGCE